LQWRILFFTILAVLGALAACFGVAKLRQQRASGT